MNKTSYQLLALSEFNITWQNAVTPQDTPVSFIYLIHGHSKYKG